MTTENYRRSYWGRAEEPRRTLNGMLLPTKVFLGGLAPETTKDQVLVALRKFGKPLDANIVTDRSMFSKNGEQRRFAFVEFGSEKEVEDILNTFTRRHLEIDGRRLNLNKAYRKASTFGKSFGPGKKDEATGKDLATGHTMGSVGQGGGMPLAHNGAQGWLPYQPAMNPYQQPLYPQPMYNWPLYNYPAANALPYGYGAPLGLKGGSSGTPSPTGSSTASSGAFVMGSPPRETGQFQGGLAQPAYGGSPPQLAQGWMGQPPMEQYYPAYWMGQQLNNGMYPQLHNGIMYNGNVPVFAPQGPAMDGGQMYPYNQ